MFSYYIYCNSTWLWSLSLILVSNLALYSAVAFLKLLIVPLTAYLYSHRKIIPGPLLALSSLATLALEWSIKPKIPCFTIRSST